MKYAHYGKRFITSPRQTALLLAVAVGVATLLALPTKVLSASDECEDRRVSIVLCFDLTDPGRFRASVVVRMDGSGSPDPRVIVLPIQTSNAETPGQIAATWGSFDGITMISFRQLPGVVGNYAVSFNISASQSADFNVAPTDLPQGLYLLRSGSEYRFIYFYQNSGSSVPTHSQQLAQIANARIGAIGFILPTSAEARVIPGTQAAYNVDPLFDDNQALYPATSAEAGGAAWLERRFLLPVPEMVKEAQKFTDSMAVALIAPMGTLLFTFVRQPRNKKMKIRVLTAMAFIQLGLIAAVMVLTVMAGESLAKSLGTIVASIITAFLAGYVVLFKEPELPVYPPGSFSPGETRYPEGETRQKSLA